jgi:hypothetical protein
VDDLVGAAGLPVAARGEAAEVDFGMEQVGIASKSFFASALANALPSVDWAVVGAMLLTITAAMRGGSGGGPLIDWSVWQPQPPKCSIR